MASEKDTPHENADQAPDDEVLEEPSTEKAPEEEPKAATPDDEPEPSHEAVGIGVIGGPLVDPEQGSDAD